MFPPIPLIFFHHASPLTRPRYPPHQSRLPSPSPPHACSQSPPLRRPHPLWSVVVLSSHPHLAALPSCCLPSLEFPSALVRRHGSTVAHRHSPTPPQAATPPPLQRWCASCGSLSHASPRAVASQHARRRCNPSEPPPPSLAVAPLFHHAILVCNHAVHSLVRNRAMCWGIWPFCRIFNNKW